MVGFEPIHYTMSTIGILAGAGGVVGFIYYRREKRYHDQAEMTHFMMKIAHDFSTGWKKNLDDDKDIQEIANAMNEWMKTSIDEKFKRLLRTLRYFPEELMTFTIRDPITQRFVETMTDVIHDLHKKRKRRRAPVEKLNQKFFNQTHRFVLEELEKKEAELSQAQER